MKNIHKNRIKLLFVFCSLVFLLISCKYDEIADADYPTSKLYIPAAVYGVFSIDNISERIDFIPTSGEASRFTIDLDKNKMIVPLGIYRSGLDHTGSVTVDIQINNDTITELISEALIPDQTIIMPTSKYALPTSVEIVNGSELGTFSVEIDLDYLRNLPDTAVALGIEISSSTMVVNPKLNKTVLVIYPKIFKPVAAFTSKPDDSDLKKINFINASTFALTYSWDFGDGTAAVSEESPTHSYTASGTYTVTLTVSGITGDLDRAITSTVVTVI